MESSSLFYAINFLWINCLFTLTNQPLFAFIAPKYKQNRFDEEFDNDWAEWKLHFWYYLSLQVVKVVLLISESTDCK